MKQVYFSDNVYVIEGFLSRKECDELIAKGEELGYEKAKISLSSGEQRLFTQIRNNERVMYRDQELAEIYWSKLRRFEKDSIGMSTAFGLNELFRFYKYDKGQRFKRHIDGSYERNENEFSLKTFMIYLNENFEGGETVFSDFSIAPKVGNALIFNHELKHEGTELLSGTKYVLRSDIMFKLELN